MTKQEKLHDNARMAVLKHTANVLIGQSVRLLHDINPIYQIKAFKKGEILKIVHIDLEMLFGEVGMKLVLCPVSHLHPNLQLINVSLSEVEFL